MSDLRFKGNFNVENKLFSVRLSLIEFEEDDAVIVYSPALDLYGYGNSGDEARSSFHIALEEFLRYTHNKGTFREVLEGLGWAIKGGKKHPQFKPPLNSTLVAKNQSYNEIINSKDYKSYHEDVQLPVLA